MPADTSRMLHLRRYWPTVVMVGLMLLTGYDIYDRHESGTPTLAEFDVPHDPGLVTAFGQISNTCYMDVNGVALLSRRSGYKLAIGCFVYDGREDILDSPYLQVSNLYDIKEGKERVLATYPKYFEEYRTNVGAVGIDVALLNVPKGVERTQFQTLRQARALGVLIPQVSVAKSPPTIQQPQPQSQMQVQ